jgi:hypothetical protein
MRGQHGVAGQPAHHLATRFDGLRALRFAHRRAFECIGGAEGDLAVQQTGTAISKVTIQPAEVAIQVGDTVTLAAAALDAAGRPVGDVTVRWFQDGGRFEGVVDSSGVVRAGSVGTLAVSALVAPRQGGSPVTAFARVTILPRPTSRIALTRLTRFQGRPPS